MPLGALAVHQLRYYAAFGQDADRQLAAQGHTYLRWLVLAAALLAAGLVGEVLGRLARAWRAGDVEDGADVGTLKLWVVAGLALCGLYVVQELGEGLLASGHPAGLAGLFQEGGWLAVPFALALAGVIALALRGVEAVVARVRASRRPVPGSVDPAERRPLALVHRRPVDVLARHLAGRGPPLSLV
jgi:hypothetical protein